MMDQVDAAEELVKLVPLRRVIVIDDDAVDRKSVARAFRSLDPQIAVIECCNGTEGLAQLASDSFDCIFLDYRIGAEDGLVVLETIMSKWPAAAVVMMTGHGSEEVAVTAMRLGASDYVVKDRITPRVLSRITFSAVQRAALKALVIKEQEERVHFMHSVIHDVRGPLAQMANYADFIREDCQLGRFDEVDSHAEVIALAARRLYDLVGSLAAHANGGKVSSCRVELSQVLTEARFALESAILEKDAQIDIGELPSVLGNHAELVQLFQNILGNALKFTTTRALISVSAVLRDGEVTIGIADNGIGIDPERAADIFTPFTRLNSDQQFEGSGLGLAIVRRIVERHDGRIRAEPNPGGGTVFCITLKQAPTGAEGRP